MEKKKKVKKVIRVLVPSQSRDYDCDKQGELRIYVKGLMDAGITFIDIKKVDADE